MSERKKKRVKLIEIMKHIKLMGGLTPKKNKGEKQRGKRKKKKKKNRKKKKERKKNKRCKMRAYSRSQILRATNAQKP